MSQAFYRKWRPRTWDEVVGQDHVVQTLRNALNAERIAHAYLFAGPRGTGKTTTARLLAKTVNCTNVDPTARPCGACEHCLALDQGRFLDLIEIDAASNTSVDDVRDLRDKINFSPNLGRYKVYIIDEVHMLSTAAFNALLKTLEEPPPHAIFVLATTEPHKIPATVLSRCQRHEFRRLPVDEIIAYLVKVAGAEGIQIENGALDLIARQATGSMRDAVSLLDQLASTGQEITLFRAQDVLGTATNQAVLEMVDCLIEKDASRGLETIQRALDSGSDPRQFARQIVDYLRGTLLVKLDSAGRIETDEQTHKAMQKHAAEFDIDPLLDIIQTFNRAAQEGRASWQPSLPLELALIESLNSPPEDEQTAPVQITLAETQPIKARSVNERTPQKSLGLSPEEKAETQALASNWTQILNAVRRKNPPAYGLLNSARTRYIKDDDLVLCFTSEVLKKMMEKQTHIETVKAVLRETYQKEMNVRCEVDTREGNSIPPEVDESGIVATALRDLGGEIVDIQ